MPLCKCNKMQQKQGKLNWDSVIPHLYLELR
uniref:Uncharacterized protein n=1 Tax=Arundo donax TaxID=35708 RepID=A0A0A9SKX0_ARUDO